jgi:uncharacterized protein (TIGR02246 family)
LPWERTWAEKEGEALQSFWQIAKLRLFYLRSMRKRPLYFLIVLALTLAPSSPGQTAPEAAIQHLLDQQTADWNRGDVEAFMKGYEDSPTTTYVGQTVQYGYATILERYKKLFTTPDAMGKLAFSHLAIRILDAKYAVATGNFHLERTTTGGGNADGIFSLLFKRDSSGWKIILDHTSRIG